ncbi:glycosyltransferase family 2 protein [Vibrio sp. 10N.222.51.C12]|uniref:glycosyltransferase family 2 protein n=1 Tax=unclassified Vibrio TaxID=2614977 RepID=UPI000C824A24|nr:glycosyltransferase family 2 protein [Vibrio sp. 10N.286.48.B7]PMH80365.1 glycosyltransferase [Vibrio sp. 10N.286.48.B7]
MNDSPINIAVVIPCFNEEGAIGLTIESFRSVLPSATIFVYDNNSTDNTVKESVDHQAVVFKEPRQGKGEVVRRMFSDIDADIFILTDGDNTYDAKMAPGMVETLLNERLDMVTGTRNHIGDAFPKGHIWGNQMFSKLINSFFKAKLTDVFSGYRVMTRRFVKSLPIMSLGFEIETEITVHALQTKIAWKEVPTNYSIRPKGTESKLHTFKDGFRILGFILFLIRDVKPLLFFSILSGITSSLSLALGVPVIHEFFDTGIVPRFPTAILASAIALISIMCLFVGLILDNVSRGRVEAKKLHFLSIPINRNNI